MQTTLQMTSDSGTTVTHIRSERAPHAEHARESPLSCDDRACLPQYPAQGKVTQPHELMRKHELRQIPHEVSPPLHPIIALYALPTTSTPAPHRPREPDAVAATQHRRASHALLIAGDTICTQDSLFLAHCEYPHRHKLNSSFLENRRPRRHHHRRDEFGYGRRVRDRHDRRTHEDHEEAEQQHP